mmetsp:Transcript_42726/g.133909  ORF Transcript_42726/g.133909 Transcript_42726/m.133909 type:complete len:90 (+) Transcript_42726:202-471(+)
MDEPLLVRGPLAPGGVAADPEAPAEEAGDETCYGCGKLSEDKPAGGPGSRMPHGAAVALGLFVCVGVAAGVGAGAAIGVKGMLYAKKVP